MILMTIVVSGLTVLALVKLDHILQLDVLDVSLIMLGMVLLITGIRTAVQSRKKESVYFLKTKRIGFRTWNTKDLPLAMILWGDPKVTELIDARGQLSKEQVGKRLDSEIAMQEASGVQYWPIFLIRNHEFLGCCGLRPYKADEGIFELGVHLCSNQWGKGYAEEACRTVIHHAFDQLKVHGLFAGHNPSNIRSRHLLQKLGFSHTHNQFFEPTGLHHPSYFLSQDSASDI